MSSSGWRRSASAAPSRRATPRQLGDRRDVRVVERVHEKPARRLERQEVVRERNGRGGEMGAGFGHGLGPISVIPQRAHRPLREKAAGVAGGQAPLPRPDPNGRLIGHARQDVDQRLARIGDGQIGMEASEVNAGNDQTLGFVESVLGRHLRAQVGRRGSHDDVGVRGGGRSVRLPFLGIEPMKARHRVPRQQQIEAGGQSPGLAVRQHEDPAAVSNRR